MSDHLDSDWHLLANHLIGDATDEEVAAIKRWIEADPERQAQINRLGQVLETAKESEPFPFDRAAIESNVMSRIGVSSNSARSTSVENRARNLDGRKPTFAKSGLWRTWPRIAVAVGLSTLGAAVLLWSNRHRDSAASTTQYATRAGQRAHIVLADGSRMTLGPATTARVQASRSRNGMHVSVDGEALFIVAHHQGTPFVVQAGPATVRVLGTTFVVRQYSTDSNARVIVADGKVSLRATGENRVDRTSAERILTAQTIGVVTDSGTIRVTSDIGFNDASALLTGRLAFDHVPLRDVVRELNRAYDVDLRVVDSTLASAPLTMVVPIASQSLSNVLNALLETLNAHAVRHGRTITIVPGRPTHRRPIIHPLTESSYGR